MSFNPFSSGKFFYGYLSEPLLCSRRCPSLSPFASSGQVPVTPGNTIRPAIRILTSGNGAISACATGFLGPIGYLQP